MQRTRCWPACTRSWAAEARGLIRKTAAVEILILPALISDAHTSCGMSSLFAVCYKNSETST